MVLSVPSLRRLIFSLCLIMTRIEHKVTHVENNQPGINVGPYIGNKNRLAGITPHIINIAHTQVMMDKITDVSILVKETFLVIFKIMKYVTAGNIPNIQVVPHIVPMKQETPLPPLKEAKIGQQCPIVHPKIVSQ